LAVAYLRVSTAEQHLGPEAQRASIDAWARARGVEVVAWHQDQGVSGASEIDEREGLRAALGAIEEMSAGLLVVAKRDRLARDVVVAGAIEVQAVARGARVVTADGAADGDEPMAVAMRQLADVFSQLERGQIRDRTRRALKALRAKGQRAGNVPFGYQLGQDAKTLLPAEHEVRVAARARELRYEGLTLRAISHCLATEGLLGRRGRPFGPQAVANMLAATVHVA
jgi:DNA invertase Pin-like site-specific DNA recombinase